MKIERRKTQTWGKQIIIGSELIYKTRENQNKIVSLESSFCLFRGSIWDVSKALR
jgi:hypothetical protein